MASPTSKAKQWLEKCGYVVGITEHWNHFAKIRQDLFGFCDLIAIREGCPILFVQVTSYSNISARVKKITEGGDDKLTEIRLKAAGILRRHRHARVEVWGFHTGRIPVDRVNLRIVRITNTTTTSKSWNTRRELL